MIEQYHTPEPHKISSYKITGNTIQELVDFIIPRIRSSSQKFYKREVRIDLENKGMSIIDSHAGQGTCYKIELNCNG